MSDPRDPTQWQPTGRWRIRPTLLRGLLVVELEEERERYPGDPGLGAMYQHRWRRAKVGEINIDMAGTVGISSK